MAIGRVADDESGRMTTVEKVNFWYYEVLIRIYIAVFRVIAYCHQVSCHYRMSLYLYPYTF